MAMSAGYDALVSGLYQDLSDTMKLSISMYSSPEQTGSMINVGCMEIIRNEGKEWAELLYNNFTMEVIDMDGNYIGTIRVIDDKSIEAVIYGTKITLSRIETYSGS